MSDTSKKEREILVVMRKVLAQIIKDTTPPSRAMKHPLTDQTIQDIRQCLGLISARERELADSAGATQERPHFTDEKSAAKVVPIGKIGKAPPKTSTE
ncbi:MAG: segregation and condensation protein A [Sedimenticolaceae bacterium]